MKFNTEEGKQVLTIVVVIAAVYLIYKVVKGITSIGAPPANAKPDAGSDTNISVNKQNLTWPMNSYDTFADEIYQAVWGNFDISENDQTFGEILSEMNTDDDVAQLIKTYGVRGEGILIQKYYNLPQTVVSYLDNDIRERVNEIYTSKGIKFRW